VMLKLWLRCMQGNICCADLVNYVLQEEEIDTIMHFAAQTHVGTSPHVHNSLITASRGISAKPLRD
jgi:dTDP-D-glucose 4,6-dehydratase